MLIPGKLYSIANHAGPVYAVKGNYSAKEVFLDFVALQQDGELVPIVVGLTDILLCVDAGKFLDDRRRRPRWEKFNKFLFGDKIVYDFEVIRNRFEEAEKR